MRQRVTKVILVGVIAAAAIVADGVPIRAVELPTVTVSAGSDGQYGPSGACSDAIDAQAPTFEFTRTGDVSSPLSVSIAWGGDAAPGDDYGTPPTTADFATGESSVVVALHEGSALLPARTRMITASIEPSGDYEVGGPSSAEVTVTYTYAVDSGCAHAAFTDLSTNTTQRIALGQVPVPLAAVLGVQSCSCIRYAVVGGELPVGVELDLRSGQFVGAAVAVGTFTSRIDACVQFYADRTCDETVLSVQVDTGEMPRFTG
jgi:hypothetical protein